MNPHGGFALQDQSDPRQRPQVGQETMRLCALRQRPLQQRAVLGRGLGRATQRPALPRRFVPAQPAPGQRKGDRLVFVRSSSRGQTRHIYHWLGNDEFTLMLESSFDGGASWEEVMQGSYRRVP